MNIRDKIKEGLRLLSLSQIYAEDGAPATAADRAEAAAENFRTAARVAAEELNKNLTPPNLSKRAAKLLARLRGGQYYRAHMPDTPKAMHELVDAGLVTTCGRPVIIERCYVPASGYTPYKNERFEDDPFDTLTRQALDDLAEVRKEVFGEDAEVYVDFPRLTELAGKMRKALEVLEGLR